MPKKTQRILRSSVVVNYLSLRVKCGKKKCRCAEGPAKGHGPYWYAFWNDPVTKRKRSLYLGKSFRPPPGRPRGRVHSERRLPPK